MKSEKLKTIITLVLLPALLLSGCASHSEPEAFARNYYNSIINNDFETAYEMLCDESKKNYPIEDFILYHQLYNEIYHVNDIAVKLMSESTGKEIDGVKYKKSAGLNITQTAFDKIINEAETSTYIIHSVYENGAWKIHQGSAFHQLSLLYFSARDYRYDYNQHSHQSNPYDEKYNRYELALALTAFDRYDEALLEINAYLKSDANREDLSEGYNLKGLCYLGLGDMQNAKDNFLKAIELNPDNAYADTNLNLFE